MNEIPCSLCQKGGHRASHCPTLCEPLRPGFHAPSGGGGGGHSHDDDERVSVKHPQMAHGLQTYTYYGNQYVHYSNYYTYVHYSKYYTYYR